MATDINSVILSLNLDMQQAATVHHRSLLAHEAGTGGRTPACGGIMYATRGPVEMPVAGSSAIPTITVGLPGSLS
jgi:hypothetical protein